MAVICSNISSQMLDACYHLHILRRRLKAREAQIQSISTRCFLRICFKTGYTSGTPGIIHCSFSLPGQSLVCSDRLAEPGMSFDRALRTNSTVFSGSNVHLGFRVTRAIYYLIQEVTAATRWPEEESGPPPETTSKARLTRLTLLLQFHKHGPQDDILVMV